MTTTKSEFLQQDGLTVAAELHGFLENKVIPATSLDVDSFWRSFATLMTTTTKAGTSNRCEPASIARADTTIPVRACSKPVNTAWGSLYDALYNDNVIPHTAGLKPGSSINAARRDRVVRCAKDFLDKTFPLSEGSHRDAVSYMTYFQNLLVILADGSTTGLRDPKQFVGKNGPADSPDSILLNHNGSHTEIVFDRNSTNGSNDLASIEDIQLETTSQTLFDFDANCATEKCSAYSKWVDIVRCHSDRTFSDRAGDQNSVSNKNRAITTSGTKNQCPLVYNQQGTAIPEVVVDATVASLIEAAHGTNSAPITLYIDESEAGINDAFIAELEQLLHMVNTNMRIDPQESIVKVISISADTRAKPARQIIGTTSETECVPGPTTATIDAMQSHGYDVARAIAL